MTTYLHNAMLSEHLSIRELACKDGTPYPIELLYRAEELARIFEQLRGHYNKPLTILSGFRSFDYNAKVGGSPRSQHLLGKAFDIAKLDNVPVEGMLAVARKIPKVGGIGVYYWGLHIDTRITQSGIVIWRG